MESSRSSSPMEWIARTFNLPADGGRQPISSSLARSITIRIPTPSSIFIVKSGRSYHAEHPQLVWNIVGRLPPPAVRALAYDDRIHVPGLVPDIRDRLDSAFHGRRRAAAGRERHAAEGSRSDGDG